MAMPGLPGKLCDTNPNVTSCHHLVSGHNLVSGHHLVSGYRLVSRLERTQQHAVLHYVLLAHKHAVH